MLATLKYFVLLAVLALLLALGGCATTQPITVDIPVAVCPAVAVPARPELAIETLPPKPTAIQVQEAYVKSLSMCIDYTNTLDDLLAPYKKQEKRKEQ